MAEWSREDEEPCRWIGIGFARVDLLDSVSKFGKKQQPEKRKVFIDFMKKNAKLSNLDNSTMNTRIVTPPAAMTAKKAGNNMPQSKTMIKVIPDDISVPLATVLALIFIKVTKRMFLGNIASASG
ncbi:hypothetical protein HS088_TW01G00773 [Tripterygium wilfordii]|uniref:Uncharacterized protein n=1 Tax=Tripterygium wilfordii TaxID=458696 RepID=A0A7J7E2N1_TRIWF|nr:hypothetical protein HS088_TW01G00773 [Tripterygium wilfordii]